MWESIKFWAAPVLIVVLVVLSVGPEHLFSDYQEVQHGTD